MSDFRATPDYRTVGTKVIRIQNENLSKWPNPSYFYCIHSLIEIIDVKKKKQIDR